jgi:VWFA-related protein
MRLPILLTLAATLLAQTPQKGKPADEDLPAIKVDVDVVSILASVRDKRGALIPSLEKNDFTVLEDGKSQPIKYFERETDLPLTIGLLIDVSRSQENLISIERSAASEFFQQVLRKRDEAFLISFGEEAELLQDFTGSSDRPSATTTNPWASAVSLAVRSTRRSKPFRSTLNPAQ